MNAIIRIAIERPVSIMAMMLLVILFGIVALRSIPIQLSPDIEKPIYQVRVSWPGAAPEDVDREIVSRLETELSSLTGVEEISSNASNGSARVTLTYSLSTDMDKALTVLLSKIASITGLPGEASAPQVQTSNSDDSPIARLALVAMPGQDVDLEKLGSFVSTNVVDVLARTPGIAEITFNGGGKKQLRVIIDPEKLASYKLSTAAILEALRSATTLQSVGTVQQGKRVYTVRTEAIAYTPETALNTILRADFYENGQIVPVLLSDVAEVEFAVEPRSSFRRLNGQDAIIINALREPGINVVSTMDALAKTLDEVNQSTLNPSGLQLDIIYDETAYISSAIDLVQQNIWIGGVLAFSILLLFLRSLLPTFVIFIAIPVSVIGTFVAISGFGLSINVISLAGMAFAIGMVVDASIVSLENIFRLRQKGFDAPTAAYLGARQVWAPILGSALTTVLVFVPIILLDLPVGQLFRDIGIAISVSVLISVLVSVTVIPTLASKLLAGEADKFQKTRPLWGIDKFAGFISSQIVKFASYTIKNRRIALLTVTTIVTASISVILLLMPKLDYLPDGNANFLLGRIFVPPGYSIEETKKIADKMEASARPLWEKSEAMGDAPGIERFFFVAFNGGGFAGATATDPKRVTELRPFLMKPVFSEPGARAFVFQASLFGRSVGGSRSINVDLTGPSLANLVSVARQLTDILDTAFPVADGNQVRIIPSLDSGAPQIRITPRSEKLAKIGISAREFSTLVDILNDGLVIADVPINGELVELILTGSNAGDMGMDDLSALPIINQQGLIVRLDQVADVAMISAPQTIRRLNGNQALTIQVRPQEAIALESAIKIINAQVLPNLVQIADDNNVSIAVSGAASALQETWQAMQANVLIALGVIFLLLVILLRSFILPVIIILAVPIAAAGGILSLFIINLYIRQPLDMLTMLGFVILTGIVVNNAILMVEQTCLQIREEGMEVEESIIEATRNRIRPIFMSTLTSLFGLVPLVIFPGAGSELYRGIGTVVFGGLALSTVATLFIVPGLLSLARTQILASSRKSQINDSLTISK
ncbi:efflux RND transporter permease subunit [Alphaproteobacteria bacterium]|nr:efflux RND transporter permease subunit [Alphaproteobacteria bacterium]